MSDTQATFQFYVMAAMLAFVGYPFARRLLSFMPDSGWAFSRVTGILLAGWLTWILSSIGLAQYSVYSITFAFIAIGVIGWLWLRPMDILSRSARRWMFTEEVIFACVFFTWTYLRGWNPDLSNLEKFMNFGFMMSISKTDYFPPLDHFFAREPINYYYFGQFLATSLILAAKVPLAMGYHLQMSHLMALTAIETFSLAIALAGYWKIGRSFQFTTGILALSFVTLMGNLHAVVYRWIKPIASYWYPSATRFVPNTIHEFPIYSFIVNDLHAHVSALPTNLLLITVLFSFWSLLRSQPPLKEDVSICSRIVEQLRSLLQPALFLHLVIFSFLIGAAYVTNAWDCLIYSTLFGCTSWIALASRRSPAKCFVSVEVLVGVAFLSVFLIGFSILFFIPYWNHFSPLYARFTYAPYNLRSPIWRLLVLWGVHIIPLLAFCLIFLRSRHRTTFTPNIGFQYLAILFLFGVFLVVSTEFFYLQDIYYTQPRANTMFKFYYQAWILLGLASAFGISLGFRWARKHSYSALCLATVLTVLVLISGFHYTVIATYQGLGLAHHSRRSLDGMNFLKARSASDWAAIQWLNDNIFRQPTILEAVGASYTEFGRISAFTGLPTVMGWPVHEWLWRGSFDRSVQPKSQVERRTNILDSVRNRENEVRLIFETPRPEIARSLLQKYDVNYVIVGDLERTKYPKLDERVIQTAAGELLYNRHNLRIYKVR